MMVQLYYKPCKTGYQSIKSQHRACVRQALCFFYHHFSYLHVSRCWFVRSRNHFTTNQTLHIVTFRSFINQQYNQINFWMIFWNCVGNALQHHSFAGPEWRYNQSVDLYPLRNPSITRGVLSFLSGLKGSSNFPQDTEVLSQNLYDDERRWVFKINAIFNKAK